MEKEHEEFCQEERHSAPEEENKRTAQEQAKLVEEMERASQERTWLTAENARLTEEKANLEKQCNVLRRNLGEEKRRVEAEARRAEAEARRADMLENSRSYRLLAPLRRMKLTIKRLVGKSARKLNCALKKLKNRMAGQKDPATLPAATWPPLVEATAEGESCAVQTHCHRIGIYTFCDKDGIVDEYVLYYLKALSPWVDRLLVVCNGQLRTEGEAALRGLGCEILMRENKGFDAWGVRAAIEKIGFEELSQYDEAVIANNTIFGPVSGFDEIFNTMSSRKADFWGIADSLEPDGRSYIQSHFYCIRKRMLSGNAFRKFWMSLPDENTAADPYEAVMTHFFSDSGYQWECLMDRATYADLADEPLIMMPMESIRDWGCPFFLRRAFTQDYLYLVDKTGHQSASVLMRYVQEETDYPAELVWKNLIRTCHMCDLARNLHLSKVFDKDNCYLPAEAPLPKAALFMHIYDHTMAPELAAYAANLPPQVDIYISTASEEKKNAILQVFQRLPNALEIRVLPNRGRDVSALLTSFRDVVMNYEVACVTHDKKAGHMKPATVGEGFAYMGYENILGSRALVAQILWEFSQDPLLGLLCAPDPSHADFATHIGMEWQGNYQNVKKLAQELGLHAPMDEEHPPVAPYGSAFWFRTAAMAPLFQKAWTYADFPAEPLNSLDGEIMHAIERIWPYVAQHSGYYSAIVMTSDYAALEIGNMAYYTYEYCHATWETGYVPHFTLAEAENVYNARLRGNSPPAEAAVVGERGIIQSLREKVKTWAEL